MSNSGWIKLHRNLRNSFSSDKKLNIELWMLYVFLAEQAAWDDFDGLKRGFVKIRAREIQEEIFPNMYIKRIRHLISVLRKLGHIKTTVANDQDNNEGLIYEVCQYDNFSGDSVGKSDEMTLDRGWTGVRQVNIDNNAESLQKNHDELTGLDRGWTGVRQVDCSLFIEERNKEIKVNSDEQSSSPPNNVKLAKVKKERKPRAPKKPALTDSHKMVLRVFTPDPRFVKNLWIDRQAVFFAVDEFLGKYGSQGERAILEMYTQIRKQNLLGTKQYSIAFVEKVLNDSINIQMAKETENK